MSHEIVRTPSKPHDAIHDLESFWWIIVHPALTRAGLGQRRTIQSEDSEESKELEAKLYSYFDADPSTLSSSKIQVFGALFFNGKVRLRTDLLNNFHPYFEPIKDLIRDWWLILRSAFEFGGYERANIHEYVKNLLKKKIDELSTQTKTKEVDALTQKEDGRRETYHSNTKSAIRTQECVHFYPVIPVAVEKRSRPKVEKRPSHPDPTPPTPTSLKLSDALRKQLKL
jgi:hypothetical protein